MSRYIDADALKKYVDGCEFCNNCQRKKNRCAFDCVLPDYLTSEWERAIDEQPTVDAVPVVRCGECKYFIENTWECVRLSDRFGDEYSDARVYPEYYCADGERKDGADDGRTD